MAYVLDIQNATGEKWRKQQWCNTNICSRFSNCSQKTQNKKTEIKQVDQNQFEEEGSQEVQEGQKKMNGDEQVEQRREKREQERWEGKNS